MYNFGKLPDIILARVGQHIAAIFCRLIYMLGRYMKKFWFLLLTFGSTVAVAGTGQGTIAKVETGPLYSNLVFITVTGTVADQPACRASGNYHFVFDSSAPGGKNTLAMLLMAKASSQSIIVAGMAQCSLYNGVEDLRWIRVE